MKHCTFSVPHTPRSLELCREKGRGVFVEAVFKKYIYIKGALYSFLVNKKKFLLTVSITECFCSGSLIKVYIMDSKISDFKQRYFFNLINILDLFNTFKKYSVSK